MQFCVIKAALGYDWYQRASIASSAPLRFSNASHSLAALSGLNLPGHNNAPAPPSVGQISSTMSMLVSFLIPRVWDNGSPFDRSICSVYF